MANLIFSFPKRQEDYFSESFLKDLFESRIMKSRAVGLDGTRLEMFAASLDAECALISRKVMASSYKFTTFREKLISKGAQRFPRQISIPTVRDRLALRALCNCLSQVAPQARSKPPHTYIKDIVGTVRQSKERNSFIRLDVRDFFPSLDHSLLLGTLREMGAEPFVVDLVRKAITNPTGNKSGLPHNTRGVPQGLSISNILSSIYMSEVDRIHQEKGSYFRYVDDILVVEPSHLANRRYTRLDRNLAELALKAHPLGSAGKSDIVRVGEGIDYLGYRLTPERISVRASSYHRMFSNLSKVFTQFKYRRNLDYFVFKISLRITGCIVDGKRKGWLMFFSQTEDVAQLKRLDHFVTEQLHRLNISDQRSRIPTFVKAYHEIRYKGVDSAYIPNFDSFDLNRQYVVISTITGTSVEELSSRSVEITDRVFKDLVSREVTDLEQDVLDSVS